MTATVERLLFAEPAGGVPNNPALPLLVYRRVLAEGERSAAALRALAGARGWHGFWQGGVYPFHHFHADAHEALGVISGRARVQFGGEGGARVELAAGDAVLIPAGVGHCALWASADFACVGFYPPGAGPDLARADAAPADAAARVAAVPLPATDPLFGEDGPLVRLWCARAGPA
jgi:uncharacterized protein YjlB